MEATLRIAIRLLCSESRIANRSHSLSGTEEAHLDEEQEEQRNPDIVAAQAPRIPSRSLITTIRRLLGAYILFDQGP